MLAANSLCSLGWSIIFYSSALASESLLGITGKHYYSQFSPELFFSFFLLVSLRQVSFCSSVWFGTHCVAQVVLTLFSRFSFPSAGISGRSMSHLVLHTLPLPPVSVKTGIKSHEVSLQGTLAALETI